MGLREQLEPLVASFGAQVVEAPLAGLDLVVETMLAGLGQRLGLDRTTVFELTEDRRGFRPWQSWAAEGIERLPKDDIRDEFPEMLEPMLHARKPSWHVLPLRVGGATVGAHVLDGVKRAHGSSREIAAALRPLHDALAMAFLRRRSDREQARQHHELDEIERLAGSGHWTHNFALGASRGSAQLYQILRLDPRADLDLQGSARAIHPDDRSRYLTFLGVLLRGHDVDPIEVRARYGDGEIRNLRCWGEISRTADDRPRMARGVVHDITTRKRHELALTALNHRLIRAHEEERARLAREIHDDLGQQLAALKLEIDLLGHDAEASAARELAPRLAELSSSVFEVAAVVRGLSHTLHPMMLQQLGLATAVEALCRRTTMLSEVDTSFEPGLLPDELDPEVALCLYRVAQEALGNVTRHSQARTATVTLGRVGEHLVLSVCDDGVGMEPRRPTDAPGLGLLGMRERMHLVEGVLGVESAPGAGTCVTAEVPLCRRTGAALETTP
jgi:signal transduction histidine kinase